MKKNKILKAVRFTRGQIKLSESLAAEFGITFSDVIRDALIFSAGVGEENNKKRLKTIQKFRGFLVYMKDMRKK